MPELPEVETVARWLDDSVRGRSIERAEVGYPRLIRSLAPRAFCRRLQGATITAVGRRGKYILVHLSNQQTLLVHLRMTGRFFYVETARDVPKHTAAVFYFDNQRKLAFNDQRHFGVMKLAATAALHETEELRPLAPEPFSPDFSADYLYRVLQRTTRPIKEALLDQTKVLGLGNIYAAEALFLAGIHPERRAHELTRPRVRRLHTAIGTILGAAIEAGSTVRVLAQEYTDSYFGGAYDEQLQVYGRADETCLRCRALVRRIVQGNRSTFYCPRCQRR